MNQGIRLKWAGLLLATAALAAPFASPAPSETSAALRLVLDRGPATLNPRRASDAVGQRLGALIFRSLTRIDSELEPQPDLAASWEISDGGRTWRFPIRSGSIDHGGEPITAGRLARCLENYRVGKPASMQKSEFPGWTGTEAQGESVVLRLEHPSPYLARNLSLLRYFRVAGNPDPCVEPGPADTVIGSGLYEPARWDPAPETELDLRPFAPLASGRRALRILFVQDDNTRVMKLVRGDADATQNALSLTKARWVQEHYGDRFDVLEREGASVSYLAFNLRDPLLARKEVRRALSLAIDRESIVRDKLLRFCTLAGSFLSPRLPESLQSPHAFDPAAAERLLDQAGFPRPGAGAWRFTLHYRTTPVREGLETALMLQDMLSRIGVRLVIDPVEPAVFLASIKKGAFQLYSSRWIGVSDGSILYRTLRSGQPDNRVGYSNARMDGLLDAASGEDDARKRIPLMKQAQALMAEDLPYFPLWFWDNALIMRKGLAGLKADELSISGAYEPLTRLH